MAGLPRSLGSNRPPESVPDPSLAMTGRVDEFTIVEWTHSTESANCIFRSLSTIYSGGSRPLVYDCRNGILDRISWVDGATGDSANAVGMGRLVIPLRDNPCLQYNSPLKLNEILRLKHNAGIDVWTIARCLGLSCSMSMTSCAAPAWPLSHYRCRRASRK